MFSLLYGLWKYLFQRDQYFVLLLGLDNAGKTTFLEQSKTQFNNSYHGINLNKITATVGLNIGRIHTNGVILNFWDLGGQKDLQTLWDKVSNLLMTHLLTNINFYVISITRNLMQSFISSTLPIRKECKTPEKRSVCI
jgi:GTPase SAR1 family protein